MPRQVNHETRRQELAQAVWALIRTGGIEHVTLRHLADATGWSTGAIRHYLPTREAILAFAAQHVSDRVNARIEHTDVSGPPRTQLRAILHQFLPLDEERTLEAGIWLAFVAQGQATPQLADTQGVAFDALHAAFHDGLWTLQRRNLLTPGADPTTEALALHALLDGLTLHLLMRKLTPEQATGTLDAHLARLVP
ncbi:TetR/AcrR family transcriptional regulator [Deinococcus maricopensis]|uniref:Transcriptional regulator n=1 Tax=Deinococcus maricopensis (strain DSM 21211 / LMG 22137 / NRRL B-23946 / LB-34) TaxID=709986 RepID=E8U9J2_DEIML|nr:TetR/AcrR family transcriptional regulator [Deinococcus maricopensis]ADV67731.1 transcriptional regulator [Deinococcus maricopensis DSM 21211]